MQISVLVYATRFGVKSLSGYLEDLGGDQAELWLGNPVVVLVSNAKLSEEERLAVFSEVGIPTSADPVRVSLERK